MNLELFHAEVKSVISRGSSQDSKIPRWTRAAAQFLEQNYDFQHMERTGEVMLDPNAAAPNALELPNTRVKSVPMVVPYFQAPDGSRRYFDELPNVTRDRVESIDLGVPTGRWQSGNTLFFDAKPTQPFLMEMDYYEYTAWPTALDAEPTLLARYDNLMLAQTMVGAWREMRDQEGLTYWTGERDTILGAVLRAEEDSKWAGRSAQMRHS